MAKKFKKVLTKNNLKKFIELAFLLSFVHIESFVTFIF